MRERYTVTSANDMPERDLQTLPYEIAAPGAYRYYQLNVTANRGADATQLSELGLWEASGL